MTEQLIERLRGALRLGKMTGNYTERPTNIYKLTEEAVALLEHQTRLLAEARDALRPFAELGAVWSKSCESDNGPWVQIPDSTTYTVGAASFGWNKVTAGSLRRATAALSALEAAGE